MDHRRNLCQESVENDPFSAVGVYNNVADYQTVSGLLL